MRKFYLIAMVSMLAACSSHRYQANFPTIQSYSAYERGQTVVKPEAVDAALPASKVASADTKAIVSTETTPAAATTLESARKAYLQMDKAHQKAFRKELKSELKKYSKSAVEKAPPVVSKSQAIDHDLKLAAIFGAVGIVALLISGDVFFVIGAIALIIGVVFFVKWLIRQ